MLACSWRLQRLFAFETATVGGDQGEAGRGCLGFIKFCARAKFGRADEANIAGRAAKCAASGAFAAKVDDAPSAREAPHPQGRARKATGRARRAAANKEPAWANSSLARDLTTMTKAARQDMRTRRQWLRDQSRSRPDVVARARIVVHA